MKLAHRVSFDLFVGDIGDLDVLHKCDNPECTNPDHLFLGTHADNMRDASQKGRMCRGEARANSKLTESDVYEIKASSKLQKELSKLYGVHQSIISRVKNGHRWGWLGGVP
jgi:hypothetical protein